jgi:hypothetical protein
VTAQQALAWLFLTGMLVVVADYPASAGLAAALAFLFLTGVVVVYGPDAMANVGRLVGQGDGPGTVGFSRAHSTAAP